MLYKRADHQNPKWTVRLKIPEVPGFVVKSTKTTDDFEARRFLSASHYGLGTASTSLPIVDVAWRSRRARAGCGNSQHANSCRAPIGQETQRQRIAAHARRLRR